MTGLEEHQPDYKPKAYEEYSFSELGNIISFFTKRATHRVNPDKLKKDLYDAKNYLLMMKLKLESETDQLGINFDIL